MAVFQRLQTGPAVAPGFAAPSLLASLARRRWLLTRFVTRDLQLKYRGSALGVLWSLLSPLALMLVYSLVFAVLVRVPSPVPYPLFVLSGLVSWLFTARSLERAAVVLIEQGQFLQKVYVPRELLVASVVLVQLVELGFSLLALLAVALLYGWTPGPSLLLLPLWLGAQALLVFGLCLALSVATVFFRDLLPIVSVALQVWFYLSPVLYPAELALSLPWGWLYGLNPMAALLDGTRASLLGTALPPPSWIAAALLAAVLAFFLGAAFFRRLESAAVKEL